METLLSTATPTTWAIVLAATLGAGLVKGLVGFAMPMLMIAGFSTVMPPDLALAGLILPTLVANLWQALRQGWGPVLQALRRFGVFLVSGGLVLLLAAQLVPVLPAAVMLLVLGPLVTLYALAELAGHSPRLTARPGPAAEAGVGALAGFMGGLSGIWGPPTVALLTALGTEKKEHIRVQGVIYALGSILLTAAHLGSGVLNARTLPLSLGLVPVAVLGLVLGFRLQDRLDQAAFRRITLAVLLLAGLNLIRRGVMTL